MIQGLRMTERLVDEVVEGFTGRKSAVRFVGK